MAYFQSLGMKVTGLDASKEFLGGILGYLIVGFRV